MAEGMKATMLMTRRKVTVYSTGPMAESTKVAGRMENNMASVHTHPQAAKPNKANGKRVKDLIGFQAMPSRSTEHTKHTFIISFSNFMVQYFRQAKLF